MKTLRLVLFLLVALAQISVPASMIWKRQRVLSEGRIWKFRTAALDPEDPVRGRYLTLQFAAERFPRPAPLERQEGDLFLALKEDAEGFAAVDSVGYEPLTGDNVIRAEHYGYWQGQMRVRFPFDHYWLSEASAPAAERAYGKHAASDAYAVVRVGRGDAAIEELYLAGQPLGDYLRSHPGE